MRSCSFWCLWPRQQNLGSRIWPHAGSGLLEVAAMLRSPSPGLAVAMGWRGLGSVGASPHHLGARWVGRMGLSVGRWVFLREG